MRSGSGTESVSFYCPLHSDMYIRNILGIIQDALQNVSVYGSLIYVTHFKSATCKATHGECFPNIISRANTQKCVHLHLPLAAGCI